MKELYGFKPWFWTDRFMLVHKYFFVPFTWLPKLWIPTTFSIYLFLEHRRRKKRKEVDIEG